LQWSDPGKPPQNAWAKSFDDACATRLNQHGFRDLDDARAPIEGWRDGHEQLRSHISLDGHSPEEFIHGLRGRMRPIRPNPNRQLDSFEESATVRRLS
jgi:hypothetical protein